MPSGLTVQWAFLGLCPYFRSILEGDPHVILVVNRHEIDEAVPERRGELCHQPFLLLQVDEEGFDCRLPRLFVAYLLRDRFQPRLAFIEAVSQAVVTFLIFGLVERDMGVFEDALLHEFGNHLQLTLELIPFRFQRCGILVLVYNYGHGKLNIL